MYDNNLGYKALTNIFKDPKNHVTCSFQQSIIGKDIRNPFMFYFYTINQQVVVVFVWKIVCMTKFETYRLKQPVQWPKKTKSNVHISKILYVGILEIYSYFVLA